MESRFLSEINILSHLILFLIQIYLHNKMHKLPLLEIKQIEFVIFCALCYNILCLEIINICLSKSYIWKPMITS